MSEQEIFEGLKKLALEDLANVPEGEIENLSFCCYMVATRKDGSAIGGAFIVDPEVGDVSSEELVKTGSLPALASYIIMRQSMPVINRCLAAAATLQDIEIEGSAPKAADLEGSTH